MTVNESLQDRIIRTLIGFAVTVGAVMMATAVPVMSLSGIVNLFFLVLGIEVFVTGLIGWSPVYSLFGFSSTERVGT
jgi:Inner membrane protein YgaP-like, transmembrane domain